MTTVVIDGLTRRFGATTALDRIAVTVGDGEFVSLLGPSGCGKSTTLRLIAGFDKADGGRILFDGQDVSGLPPERRDIGMVFQSYALFPHMTVAANLAFGLQMRRESRVRTAERVARALELVRLEDKAGRFPRELSGGQQQRVALARALVIEPRILLLDEPLANLDARLRDEMRVFIGELQRRVGITTIYVTHDQSEAMSMSDRVVVMFDGRIAQCDVPRIVYERPASVEVARFIGQANLLAARVVIADGVPRALSTLGLHALPPECWGDLAADSLISVLLRPETVSFDTMPDPLRPPTIVQSAQYGGAGTDYRLRLPDGEMLHVQQPGPVRYQPGEPVGITLPDAPLWPIADAA
jgi:putative spermidine/putrescine transport system ATP-binding protein